MAGHAESRGGRRGSRWRIAVWGAAALMLLPLFAMQVTDEVVWDVADFAVFGAMLVVAGGTYALAARMTGNTAYRAAVGIAVAAAFVLVWLILAVGVIGVEGDPADRMYMGVLAVAIIGAVIARFQPRGMARVLFATAFAQASIAGIALIAGKHRNEVSSVSEILGLNGFFVALFVASALLFRYAARQQTPASAAP